MSRQTATTGLTVTAEGELVDLIEDFSEGRIQFAYVKVKDPNSGLPKNVLIAWVCQNQARFKNNMQRLTQSSAAKVSQRGPRATSTPTWLLSPNYYTYAQSSASIRP